MRIAITGSTGFLGSALLPFLTSGGHTVRRMVRARPAASTDDILWDPERQVIDPGALEGLDAVIHLAGENIAGRWSTEKKRRIRDSRVLGTRLLAESLARVRQPPQVLICASATGYYGDRGDEVLSDESPPGVGFLAGVCREWEAASDEAAAKGIRVVRLRFGIILSPAGGALARMLLPFRLGVGGKIGSGQQYWSWISFEDVIGTIHHALITPSLIGPVNAVAPHPVTNEEFTRILGRVLGRPAIFPMPAFAARMALGEMAEELLLSSARVEPRRLVSSGYNFRHLELEDALKDMLGRPGGNSKLA
ncbi:MAG: TIGR01777 family protein [Acidobacteria bacterium]|nr:TIGR01777 family protein [Acidobacteriota bacterium]